jgi:hypothetical protein
MTKYLKEEDLQLPEISNELLTARKEISMSRTEFALKNFVVFEKDSLAQAYLQTVLEAGVKHRNMQHALIDREIAKEKIKLLKEKGGKLNLLRAKKKEIDLEESELSFLSAKREYDVLCKIFDQFEKHYTREEIDADQAEYWRQRLYRQSALDYMADGRIGKGNLDALRQAQLKIPNFVDLPTIQQLGFQNLMIENTVDAVDRRYTEQGNEKIMIAIPSEKAFDKESIEDVKRFENLIPDYPTGKQVKLLNVHGKAIDEAYTIIVRQALRDEADYVLFIEDDTFMPKDSLVKLLNTLQERNLDVIGAHYPKREKSLQSTAIMLDEKGNRRGMPNDGQIHEAYTIPFGFTLLKTDIFRNIPEPWFVTTDNLTQDSFFSQKAREAGYKLWIDTSIHGKHIDRNTGQVYQFGSDS